jgi:FkbM family methyltransferase
MHPLRIARHYGRVAHRRLFPTPAERVWRHLLDYAEAHPQPGHHVQRLLDLDLAFPDASALATQWHDIFVREAFCISVPTRAPRVLDCGAHIGLASLWIKRQWPAARITAFEADPALAAMLKGNLQRNAAGDIEVVEAAVWRESGTVSFRAPGSDAGAIDLVATDSVAPMVQVSSVRLRDWLTEPIDLLKLDIEGAELAVLEDSADRLEMVRNLHMEVHEFDERRRLLPRCLLRLEEAGFTYALSDLGSALWRTNVRAVGPFRNAVPSWVIVVRAWRSE